MESRNRRRLLVPMLLVLAAGQAASVWAQEAPPPATPTPDPAPALADGTDKPVRLRFTFKDAPYDQVLDFLARETGLPVIREADLPPTPVTFISAADYSVAEALEVLNRMLFMHGLQVRRESNFLLLTRLEDLKALGEKFVGEIPPGVGDTQFVTVVIPLLNATAEQLADRLKVLSGKHGAIAALPQQNALVVVDTAAQCRRIRELVEQLDQDPPSDSQVRLFPLRHAKADAVYNALKGLVAEKRSTILVDEKGKRTTVNDENFAGLNLQPDPRTNSIIAVGPLARLATIEELIALLDRPEGGALEDREVMTFALATISADEAARTVASLFGQTPPERKPTILPLASQGKLTVLGAPAQLAQIAAVLGEADPGVNMAAGGGGDASPAAAPETRSAVVRLTHVTPAAAQSILDRLLSPRQKAVLRYTASPDNKGLIVSGPVGDVDRFTQILSGIDTPMELDREVRQVRIAGGDPAAVLAKANELYLLRSAAKTDPVSATLDADARTVTIVGSPAALNAFADLLRSAEANATIDREMRVFDLARVRPSEAAPRILRLARPLLEPADGAAYVEPQVEAADELGQVIVRAAPDQFAVIERLVKSVDEAGPTDRAFRVIRATAAGMRASELRDKAVQIYAAQAASAPGAGAIDVTVDEAANAMLVVADAESLRRFTAIVDELQRQAGPARDLRMLELRNARAADVVGFLNQMLESSRPFSAHSGPDPVFEAIEATNSILVAAQPSQFAVIEHLVRSLDSRQTSERPPLRILRLRTTDAANIAQVLNSTYSQRPAEQRARLPVDIQADAATNTLIVSAHPDVFPEIERIVTELNETAGVDAQGREIRIFPLKVAQAEDLARTIDQMYPEPPMPIDPRTRQPRPDLRPPREIVVRADRLTNSLIVDAPVNRLAGFEQLVRQLDQQKLPENVELRTYRVERAQLDAVASTLRSLAATNSLTGGVPASGGVGSAISISTEPVSRTLIVSGPTQIFPQVEKVLAELDSPPERPETGLRMYALRHARAERLQPLLDRLLTARLREQQDKQGRPVADVRSLLDVAADNATNSLIISAPESIQQIAAELVKALDTPAAETGRPVIRVVPLTFADATQTAATLNAALPTMDLPSGGRVTVMAIAGSNALLLSGAEADLGKVEELVTTLDVRPMTEGAVGVQTFALKHADAAAIAQTVQRLLVEQQETDPRILSLMIRANRGQIPRPPQVRVEPDVRTNSLVISAPVSTLSLAETIIERLDQPAEESGRSASTFTPAKADPRRLVAAAKPILDATLPVGRRPVELTAEPASGSIVVIGTDEQVARAVKVLAELDDRAVAVPQVDLQIIDVQHADAAAVARTVQAMLADRSRWPEDLLAAERAGLGVPTLTVNADAKANRLAISAPAALMPIARDLVAALDRPSAQSTVEVRVFTLSKSDAASVAAALRAGLAAGASPGEPAPVVTPEPGSNSVVVAAAPDRLRQAAAIVKELDTATKPDGVAVRTVTLRHARAETIAPIVETLLTRESVLDQIAPWQKLDYLRTQKSDVPPVRVAAEPRLNAVVVTGPAGIIEIAEQVISELDVEPDGGGDGGSGGDGRRRSVRVLALSHADAAEVAANIQAVFDDKSTGEVPPTVRVDRGSNSLIIRASDAQLRTIESLVADIDAATLTTSRDLRLIPIDRSRADAQVMAETLQRLLQQRGNVRVEVISAEDLLKPRPQTSAPPAETPDRRGGDARPVHPASPDLHPGWIPGGLHAALASLALATLPDDPPAPAASKPEPSEAPVTIAVDPATNSLIVLGSSRMAQRVAALAAELERQMPAEPGRVRIITLPESADARAVAQVVSSTVRQIGQRSPSNPGGFTGRVAVDADPAGGALIVSANDTDFEPLGELIAAIARPAPSASLTVKIYPLSNITAARAIRAVNDLLSPDPRSRQARRLRTLDVTLQGQSGESGRAVIDPDAVRITADPGGASLIVAAPADALPLLDRFIAMIDQAPVADRMAIRRYELVNAKGADIARTLQSTFDAARQGLGAAAADIPRANFSSDARTNSLLVTATEAQLREVEALLRTLDAPLADDGTEVAIIPLQVARPTSVKEVVETVLAGRDPAKRDRIAITATDDSSLFVIRAEPEQIAQARAIVAEMDKAETAGLPVRSVKLQRADAESVARALQQFFEDRARAQSRPGQRPRTRQVAVVGDRRTSTLVVSASDEDFRQIESLIETFDAPAAARDLQFRIIPLQHARTTEIRTAVQNIVAELIYPPGFWWGVGRGQQEPQDTLVVEFNDRSNSVILMGQGEQFATVERLIQSLDLPASDRAALAVRAVRLKHADPRSVATAIQNAMTSPDWPRWRGPDPDGVRAETDQRSRTLFLIGRPERLEQAAAYAQQFDAAAAQPDAVMKSIPLRFARAEQVAANLQRFFHERARAAGETGRVSVIGSRDGNVVIVSAPEDEMALVRQMLASMDQPEEGEGRARRLFQLRNADAREIAQALREQFPRSEAAREGMVIVTPQPSTNSLIVSAPEEIFEKVEALVAQLDSPPSAEDSRIVTVTLSSARADDVAASLRQALPKNVKVTVTPVRRSNSLLLTGSDEAIRIVMDQIATLDQEPTRSPVEFRRIRLENADAYQLSSTIREMLRARPATPGEPAPAVSYSTKDNTLLISAAADQIDDIQKMINELDVPATLTRTTEFVPLKFADATATARALDVFYGRNAPEASTPGARNVTIIANPLSRSLVISAEADQWPGIRSLLEKLDNDQYDTSRRLEIVPLRHADAVSLAATLTEAFVAPLRAELDRQRSRGQQQPRRADGSPDVPTVLVPPEESVTVVAERLTNALVISAVPQTMERLRRVIEQLDVPEFARLPEARVIPLRSGSATDIAAALRQMFTDVTPGAGRQTGLRSVLIAGDNKSRTLIVRADDAQFAQIKALADTLQQEGDRALASVRVLRLSNIPAGRLAPTLRTTFAPVAQQAGETLAVEIDRASNAVVIASSERLFEQIRKVAEELDAAAPLAAAGGAARPDAVNGLGQSIFIIDVENNSPEQVRRQLEQMGLTRPAPADRPGVVSEPVTIVPLASRRALAVVANPADGQAVVALVRSLDAAPALAEQHAVIVRLRTAQAAAVAQAMEALIKPRPADALTAPAASLVEQVRRLRIQRDGVDQDDLALDLSRPVRILPEPQTNSILIVSAKPNCQALAELVRLLDRLPIGDAVTVRFFPLDNASAQRTANVIKDLFAQGDRLRQTPATNIRGEPQTEVGKALAGQIAVAVDERTNALVVAGREEAVALVEILVRQLDSDAAAGWIEPSVIPLKHADASRLAETLRKVLVDNIPASPEAAALQRQVARIRVLQQGKDPADPASRIEADAFAPLSSLVILPEPSLNALIVLGSNANTAAVAELVRMLDVPAAAADNAVRVYPLRFAAADRVAAMLREIFRQQVQTRAIRPEDDLVISADARTNALIVSTSPRSFLILEKLLATLDGSPLTPTVGMHIVPVPGGNVADLAPKIERLMRDRIESATRAGAVRSASDTFSVTPEPATGSLLVVASDENLQMVKDLVAALSSGAESLAASEVVDIVPVSNAGRAEDLIPTLRDLYIDKENARRGNAAVQVTPGGRVNALVVRGTPADVQAIRDLVQRLDSAPITNVTEIKRIELRRADAVEAVRLLQSVLAGRPIAGSRSAGSRQAQILRFIRDSQAGEIQGRTGRPATEAEISGAIQEQVTLTAEQRTNSVVVVAPARLMALIEELISDLDTTVAGARSVEIFRLKNADARAMAEVLRDLFNLNQQGDTFVLVPDRQLQQGDPGAPGDAAAPTSLYPVNDVRQQLAITIDPRTNSLLVSATAEYLEEVRKVVLDLDAVEANEREQLIYTLRNTKAVEVAATMRDYFKSEADTVRQTLGADRAGSLLRLLEREVTVQGDEKSNRLIVGVSPRYRESIDRIVKELDATPPQVLIQVLLAEVTLDSSRNWGVDVSVGPFGGDDYRIASLAAGAGVSAQLGVPNIALSSADFELLIRALEVQGRLEVLSRPQILVKNNTPASIEVGEDIGIVTGVERLFDGNTRSEVERRKVGIILNVTPSISDDGFLSLVVEPEISNLSSRTTQISEDFQAPVIDIRTITTQISVRDGETILIGGLFQTRDDERKTKIPVLGDLPFVGEVFRSEQVSQVKTELLVILTPRVIRSGQDEAREAIRRLTEEELNRMSQPDRIRTALPMRDLDPPAGFPAPLRSPFALPPEEDSAPTAAPDPANDPRGDSPSPVSLRPHGPHAP